MGHSTPILIPAHLHDLAALASLLERLERQPHGASAEQYREVVRRLSGLLAAAADDAGLEPVLRVAPATAELYENLRYAQAGLCRSPLEPALNAELATTALLRRAASKA